MDPKTSGGDLLGLLILGEDVGQGLANLRTSVLFLFCCVRLGRIIT